MRLSVCRFVNFEWVEFNWVSDIFEQKIPKISDIMQIETKYLLPRLIENKQQLMVYVAGGGRHFSSLYVECFFSLKFD